ncbi:alpha/beta hydrolase [Pararhodospirillum photometricum]|uniref:Alpha/beta hydrolase fold n=1 Tax=Pararhodospirillum photometricum DSM 122 TaxID=1150469 RepID=H6SJY2_PARPM|nr:alpha/beta hydrolase [Pararhodospirillum photometricum]CCG08297.1 Alpha/beta hydrolase fold [Pararhodospirillum photometricum DSM 122]
MRRLGALLAGVLSVAACAGPEPPPMIETTPGRVTDDAFLAGDGAVLPARLWRPAGDPVAVVVALHGFNDHAGAFETAGPALAARGLLVFAYDQRGFGRAPGRGTWPGAARLAADARAAVQAWRARAPNTRLYLLGESMGGAVALAAATGPDAPPDLVDGLILSAPAVWARSTMPWAQRAVLWLAARLVPGLTLTGRSLGRYPSDNLPLLERLAEDPLWIRATRVAAMAGIVDVMDLAYARAGTVRGPVLMLYGLNDQIIPATPTRDVARRLPEPPPHQRLAVYPEGWHMLLRDLQAARVLDDIAAWVRDPQGPLPSGADARAPAFCAGTLRSREEEGERLHPRMVWEASHPSP